MTHNGKIRIIVVEDSAVARMLLVNILDGDPCLQVIGTARDGLEALQVVADQKPDVVLMDIHMPRMDGFEATRRIMETCPIPIVVCSATANLEDATVAFRLMEAGAVACLEKPVGHGHIDFKAQASLICRTVKLMSEVRVVRRWPRRDTAATPVPIPFKPAPAKLDIVSIGASTGGPPVLQTILAALPRDFPLPIVIVQHIAPGFLDGLTQWLNQTTGIKVLIAGGGTHMLPGHAYLAPDDHHLTVCRDGSLRLTHEELHNGLRPSVDCLFHSVAESFGAQAVGVLLTGMGKDGAQGLRAMQERGAVTIAQDRETSVVFGMPGEAVALGAAASVLPPVEIAAMLARLAHRPLTGG